MFWQATDCIRLVVVGILRMRVEIATTLAITFWQFV